MATISWDGRRYIWRGTYAERLTVKAAGWQWDPTARVWHTRNPAAVRAVLPVAPLDTKAQAQWERVTQQVAASQATTTTVAYPAPPGKQYFPFQQAGIAFALEHRRVLIADEPGLGKTMQAIGVINAVPTIQTVLIVAPLSAILMWASQLRQWLVRPRPVGWAEGRQTLPTTPIVLVHWDVVAAHAAALRERTWDLIVLDEAHYAKNPKAQRTQAIMGSGKWPPLTAPWQLALTGTPMANRPAELWPLLHWLQPETWDRWWPYAQRYCGAYHNGWGWDFSGASHLDELQYRLRASCMIRRLKREVLTDLPTKLRTLIPLPPTTAAEQAALAREQAWWTRWQALQAERAALDPQDTAYREAVARLQQAQRAAFTELSVIRHETAQAKLPAVIQYVRDLRDSVEKVLVFCWHRDIWQALREAFPGSVGIIGGESMAEREAAIQAFQTGPAPVFVATIGSARESITLTAAHHVVFAEVSWVPKDLAQAEDRVHRIGQTQPVTVHVLALDGSLDAKMLQTVVRKGEWAEQALDGLMDDLEAFSEPLSESPSDPPVKEKSAPEGITDPAQRAAIHQALQQLAGLDTDWAAARNGIGFNKRDAAWGHTLAERAQLSPKQAAAALRLVRRYRRQLDPALVAACLGQTSDLIEPDREEGDQTESNADQTVSF